VCGILIEQAAATVVGIGLNVRQSAARFAQAGLPLATSLAQFTGAPLDTHAVAKQLLHRLDEEYDRLCRGDLATLESGWNRHLGLVGRQVAAECPDGIHRGCLRQLTFDAVELERPGAPPLVLPPERVQHLEPA
jgi:BirA family biotin operon repressor/biotin-[acetyl-CoA-carboxylase] ligase